MELMGSESELSAGYKLVPWSCWDQWKFVKESIFSSSPDAVGTALQKVFARTLSLNNLKPIFNLSNPILF